MLCEISMEQIVRNEMANISPNMRTPIETAVREASVMEATLQENRSKLVAGEEFDLEQSKRAIEANLTALQNAIIDMSRVCLTRTIEFTEKLQQFESDVNGVDSVLIAVKDSASSQAMNMVRQEGHPLRMFNPITIEREILYPTVDTSTSYNIDIHALDGVGISVNDPNPKQPLITVLKPGQPRPSRKV